MLSDRLLREQVEQLAGVRLAEAVTARIGFFPARRPGRGDVCTDAALLARLPAALLAERLAGLATVREVRVAAPGFINLSYDDAALDRILPALLARRTPDPPPAGPLTLPLESMRRRDPGFMVQYAHARCRSLLRAAALMPGLGWDDAAGLAASAAGQLTAPPARALLCCLDHWLRLADSCGLPDGKARISLFLRDLSVEFDRIWMLSHQDATLRLLHPAQPARSRAYLALVLATADVIRIGLGLLGMDAAEEIG